MNPILREEKEAIKKDLAVTANKALDGLDIVLEESNKAVKKVWKDTEDSRHKAMRSGLKFARKMLDKAEQKFVDKL